MATVLTLYGRPAPYALAARTLVLRRVRVRGRRRASRWRCVCWSAAVTVVIGVLA